MKLHSGRTLFLTKHQQVNEKNTRIIILLFRIKIEKTRLKKKFGRNGLGTGGGEGLKGIIIL